MFFPPVSPHADNPYWVAVSGYFNEKIMAEHKARYEPGGKLLIQQEIEDLVALHEAIPGGVDGLCAGCDANGEHAADHLVKLLVENYRLPWTRHGRWWWRDQD